MPIAEVDEDKPKKYWPSKSGDEILRGLHGINLNISIDEP